MNGPQARQLHWPVFVCKQGIFLFDPNAYCPIDPEEVLVRYRGVTANPLFGHVVLPPCRDKDELLKQPPLGISLTQDEAAQLIDDTVGAAGTIAATDIGPTAQEKGSNQDFALAATINVVRPDNANDAYQFAAVADGVTTRTLWPERSARIAVLCAWRVAREHVKARRGFTHEAFDKFRDELVRTIRQALERDMACLLGSEEELVPPGWAPDTYRQFKPRKELWYNSTLLVALVGPEGGFVLTAGDGGLVVHKTEKAETKSTVLVYSTDDVSVSGVVSLGADALKFRQARIAVNSDTRIQLIMSTDGVDRSLRRAASSNAPDFNPYDYGLFDLRSSIVLRDRVEELLSKISEREIDNVSVATLCWPPSAAPRHVPAPNFQGTIAPANTTADQINDHAERIMKRGQSEVTKLEREQYIRKIDRLQAIESSSLHHPSFDAPLGNKNTAVNSPKPASSAIAETKWGHLKARSSNVQDRSSVEFELTRPFRERGIDTAGEIATRFALKYSALDSQFKKSDVQRFIDVELGRLDARDREQFEIPNFSKIIFYGFANAYLDVFRVCALRGPDIECQVDAAIRRACGNTPCIAFGDINSYGSKKIMQLVTDALREARFLPSDIFSGIERGFSSL